MILAIILIFCLVLIGYGAVLVGIFHLMPQDEEEFNSKKRIWENETYDK